MNLGDPELELIDPTPNVHSLFLHFDKMFFWTKLASRAVVRWSKRMYSCAGICSYEGRGGLCDIALSEPLLKLRPRKDLVETLLHEMIHAFLFVTNRDQDRDGHGPNFKAHMNRINKCAGLNISIYHSFHDEVEVYQTHWWRCNGPCQTKRPHFGIVRRPMNKAPGPSDYWWKDHIRYCGGTFVKIKEPEKPVKGKGKKNIISKPTADITKYINSNIKTINNIPNSCNNNNPIKPILKDSSNINAFKTNNSSTIVVSKKGVVFNPTAAKPPTQSIAVFTGSGHTLVTNKRRSNSVDVTETVRSIWAKKEIPSKGYVKKVETSPLIKKPINSTEPAKTVGVSNPKKHKTENTNLKSPPTKMKKIEDYFNATTILKDLYGDDYRLTQSSSTAKLVAVKEKFELVECPICNGKFSNEQINMHLDECLNKDLIEKLSKDNIQNVYDAQPSQSNESRTKLHEVIGNIPPIPAFKGKVESTNNVVDLTYLDFDINKKESNIGPEVSLPSVISLLEQFDEDLTKKDKEASHRDRRRNTVSYITMNRGDVMPSNITEENHINEILENEIQPKPGPSKEETFDQVCPCCGKKFDKPVEEHLDECLMFFDNNTTVPDEGASTSYSNNTTIVIQDEDDIFDESQILNATGTKTPCPCCMNMVEEAEMNDHLDLCLK